MATTNNYNDATFTLVGAVSAAALSITVNSATPVVAAPFPFRWDNEIATCTLVSGTTWTILRATEPVAALGAVATTHADATVISLDITASSLVNLVLDRLSSTTPAAASGTGVIGTGVTMARSDHAHPAPAVLLTKYSQALTPAIVAANTTAEQTFTVTGLATTDTVFVNKPTAQAGLGIVGARVTAANTLGITFSNNTAAGITPTAAETYKIVAIN